jgi:hypothetical protein
MAGNMGQGSQSSQTPLLIHRRISVRQNLKYIMGRRVEIEGGDVEHGEIPIGGGVEASECSLAISQLNLKLSASRE